MPPKPKFTKEQVAAAALAIIKEKGVAALTARELGSRLGSSARPIFTTFRNMDEVRWAARALALEEFESYTGEFTAYKPAFKQMGILMVSYGIRQPELFKLLFMQEHGQGRGFEDALRELGSMAETSIRVIRQDYAMTTEEARVLFEQMWVHAFGMGALCALGVCSFPEEEISEKLGQVFTGMVMMIKSGQLKRPVVRPHREAPEGEDQPEPLTED